MWPLCFPLSAHMAGSVVASSVPATTESLVCRSLADGITMSALASRGPMDQGTPFEAVLAIGAFDGVHRGHRALLASCVADARERGVAAVALTFDPDPADLLAPSAAAGTHLLPVGDRVASLLNAGMDAVLVFAFTRSFAALSYRAFFDTCIAPLVRVASVHVGEDFRLGAAGEGTVDALARLGAARGFDACGHRLVRCDGVPITATRIRSLLHAGLLDEANGLLGRCHMVRGVVEHGRGEGASFGFPTANVRCKATTCMPSAGVYAAYVVVDEASVSGGSGGMAYAAAVNVGAPPTFSDVSDPAFLEANLIGYEGDLYGRSVAVIFCHRIRSPRRFESLEELERVVYDDIGWVRDNLGAHGVRFGGNNDDR